jgi:mercuric ion transport protein
MKRTTVAGAGAVGAAFLASLCCIGPVIFVALGVGAGLASTFEPLRPVFVALTIALVAMGFYVVYGRKPAKAGRARAAPCRAADRATRPSCGRRPCSRSCS